MGTSGLQQPMHFLSTVSRSNSTYSSFFELDMSILTPPCSPFFPTLHSRKTAQFIWSTLRSVLSCFVRVWIFLRISDAVPIAEVLRRVCDQVGGPDNCFSAFQLFGRQCPGPKQRSRVWPDRSATFLMTSFDWSQCIFLLQGDRSPLKGISAEARSMNHPTMTSLYFLSHSSQAGSVWEINGNCSKHL